MIFSNMAEHAKVMVKVLDKHAESQEPLEARKLARKFGMDSMGSCIFGFEINTLLGENDDFQKLAGNLVSTTWRTYVSNMINEDILRIFRFRVTNREMKENIIGLIAATKRYREENKIQTHDIFHYMQQITDESIPAKEIIRDRKLSELQMIVQTETFFVGGFETSSALVAFVLLELALHQDLQDKLRRNIRERLGKHEGFTYEAVMEMDYLDCVVNGKSISTGRMVIGHLITLLIRITI